MPHPLPLDWQLRAGAGIRASPTSPQTRPHTRLGRYDRAVTGRAGPPILIPQAFNGYAPRG